MVEMVRFAKDILAMTPPDPFSMRMGDYRARAICSYASAPPELDRHNHLQLLTMTRWISRSVVSKPTSSKPRCPRPASSDVPGRAISRAKLRAAPSLHATSTRFRSWGLAKAARAGCRNPSRLRRAGLARKYASTRRSNTILVKDHEATGVVRENGDYHIASVVLSSVDPRLTFMRMVGADHLPADFAEDIRRYKFRGSSGKVNLALDGLPDFTAMPGPGAHLRGAISISPSVDYMEHAFDDAIRAILALRPVDTSFPAYGSAVAPPQELCSASGVRAI